MRSAVERVEVALEDDPSPPALGDLRLEACDLLLGVVLDLAGIGLGCVVDEPEPVLVELSTLVRLQDRPDGLGVLWKHPRERLLIDARTLCLRHDLLDLLLEA